VQCFHKLKAFVAFLTGKRDDLVKEYIDTALKVQYVKSKMFLLKNGECVGKRGWLEKTRETQV